MNTLNDIDVKHYFNQNDFSEKDWAENWCEIMEQLQAELLIDIGEIIKSLNKLLKQDSCREN
jgi:hypothetical protein